MAVVLFIVGPGLAFLRLVTAMTGFLLFALGGLAAIIVALAGLVRMVRGKGMGLGHTIALLAAVGFILMAAQGRGAPRINDFSTDLADPPAFRQAAAIPANQGRDMGYPASFAELQRSCCDDLKPGRVATSQEEAFRRAQQVAESMPSWTVTHVDAASGQIEVVATSRLFGFQDDVVIRVRADGGASRVDVRSKSRDGQGDLGANAARIRGYLSALETAR